MVEGPGRSLAGITLLEGVPPDSLRHIEQQCRWHRWEAHEQIIDRESDSRDVYFITQGRVRVVNYSLSGREIALDDIDAGGYFGELAALDGHPRSATVVSLTKTATASLSPAAFETVLRRWPDVSLAFMRALAGVVRMATERIMDLSTLGAHNRVQAEILREARPTLQDDNTAIVKPVPVHADIASRVSTTRETVARVLSDLSRQGIIKRQGHSLLINDFEELERMVEHFRAV